MCTAHHITTLYSHQHILIRQPAPAPCTRTGAANQPATHRYVCMIDCEIHPGGFSGQVTIDLWMDPRLHMQLTFMIISGGRTVDARARIPARGSGCEKIAASSGRPACRCVFRLFLHPCCYSQMIVTVRRRIDSPACTHKYVGVSRKRSRSCAANAGFRRYVLHVGMGPALGSS